MHDAVDGIDGLDEHAEALLGRALLGQASPGELAELDALRADSPRLQAVMDLLEGSEPHFRRTSLGEDKTMHAADLPDYLRPQGLARGLTNWFRIWVVTGAVSAVAVLGVVFAGIVMSAPGVDAARVAVGFGSAAGAAMLLVFFAGYRSRGVAMQRVAEGGGDWQRAVEAVQRQERMFFSPTTTAVQIALAFATALLLLAGGIVQGPAGGALLFFAAVTLAGVLLISKRRWLLRGLRFQGGER